MRNLILLLIYMGISSTVVSAQPIQNALSGSIIKDQNTHSLNNEISISDFKYVGDRISQQNSMLEAPRTIPAIALLSSAIIPGSGQAANGKWGRAAAYFLIDVASILYYVDRNNTAKRNEQAYEEYADKNWSVLAYAQWLVEYSRANNLDNEYDQLESHIFGKSPNWGNTPLDWLKVDLAIIRPVEDATLFYYLDHVESTFSHHVQDYGSQQYYELMSKYYQFQPGWRDFYEGSDGNGGWTNDPNHLYRYSWDVNMLTLNFIEGRDRAEEFNNNYRQAGNILKLMLVNHVVSAFDAYFTVKLKNSKIETQANLLRTEALSVTWYF